VLGALLRADKDRKIRYNYPQLAGTHKALKSLWIYRIKETQFKNKDLADYKNKDVIYNATPQKGINILLFKVNYRYNLVTLLTPQ